tara:strand:+ start:969 stop:1730 length:762 start_codon:yes stop_codon:yes gene_type:complete
MNVEIIKCLQDNYSYLIIDKKTNSACIIDPSESSPIINFIEKNKIKLNFILNTHHHYDHVGGNNVLKKKYNAKVIGFEDDKDRIPEIDIYLKDREIWTHENFKAQIFHIPGHTSGHICYHFIKEKMLFTGDTLFSLGCGRIFEGTYKQLFTSLNLLKSFDDDTKVYCGHEYTLKNSSFCLKYDNENLKLKEKIKSIKEKLNKGIPTIPTTIKEELETNIFFRSNQKSIQKNLKLNSSNALEIFSKLRKLKDNY